MYYFSLYVVKHYCIIFVFYFFRATGIEFLVAHYIRSIHLGLQFYATLVCEDGCRVGVIGFIPAH